MRKKLCAVIFGLISLSGISVSADQKISSTTEMGGVRVQVRYSAGNGLLRSMTDSSGKGVMVGDSLVPETAEKRAMRFVESYGDLFGVSTSGNVRVMKASSDAVGLEHVRLQQMIGGIPVTAGEISLHLRGNHVVAFNAITLPDTESLDKSVSISPEHAMEIAAQFVQKHNQRQATLSPPRLEVFNKGLLEGSRTPTRMAYFVKATDKEFRKNIWIDANHGAVLLAFDDVAHSKYREIYDSGASDAYGTLVRSEVTGNAADEDADYAYDYLGDAYDFFFDRFQRDSFDDQGAKIVGHVHWCDSTNGKCPYGTAHWNGAEFYFGEGTPDADDLTAHEFTHGVTQYSAGLYYYMQSGALNESFSDIFGESVDLTNGSGTDTTEVRWQFAEENGAFRNLMNPGIYGHPERVGDSNVVCNNGGFQSDNGGVHFNSGITNHAFALMVDGGNYNGLNITGIGIDSAVAIEYRALTVYLLSASDFQDKAWALEQSCNDLIGTQGITSDTCSNVALAIAAVEMNDPWPCTPVQPQSVALCPAGQTPQFLFSDDLENASSGNWDITLTTGVQSWIYPTTAPFATSGTQMLQGNDPPQVGWSNAEMTGLVPISSNTRMQFNHSYGFENSNFGSFYDGGVVQYRFGDKGWDDAGSMIVAGATYGGTLSSCCGNPLAGNQAFVGESFGYTATQLDLSSLVGQSVQFRFSVVSDSSVGDYGWFIDDVRIYNCVSSGCDYSLSSDGEVFGFSGGSGELEVLSTCNWQVATNRSWIKLNATSGTGNGTVPYTIGQNFSPVARSGQITVGNESINVVQASGPGKIIIYYDLFEDEILGGCDFLKGDWLEQLGRLEGSSLRKAIGIAQMEDLQNYTIETTLRTMGGVGNRIGVLGWYSDKGNNIELLGKEESEKWILKQRVGGKVVAKTKILKDIDPNMDYRIKISFDGSEFQVFMDDELLATVPKAAGSSPHGKAGFEVKATTGIFDDLLVYQ